MNETVGQRSRSRSGDWTPHAAQTWSASVYSDNARFVSDLGAAVLDWLAPQPGERILDLGCGDGALTVRLKEAGADVLGVDPSDDFVAATRARGVPAQTGDGEALTFENDFDAVFSNAALHWMTRPDAVASGVHAALKPGGRFVAEFGGHGNVAAIVTGLRALADKHGIDPGLAKPWYFPTAAEYETLLSKHGFDVERIATIPRPTPLPSGLKGWIRTFREPYFAALGERAGEVLDELEALLCPVLADSEGNWTADYVRLRFVARAS